MFGTLEANILLSEEETGRLREEISLSEERKPQRKAQ